MALAMVAPAPGSTPMTKPARELRTLLHQVKVNSFRLNSMRPLVFTACWPVLVCSSISSISLTLNRPMTTITNWIPSDRPTLSKVKR
ncbi:hypothetical protein D9M71_489560 [compost metagenome]